MFDSVRDEAKPIRDDASVVRRPTHRPCPCSGLGVRCLLAEVARRPRVVLGLPRFDLLLEVATEGKEVVTVAAVEDIPERLKRRVDEVGPVLGCGLTAYQVRSRSGSLLASCTHVQSLRAATTTTTLRTARASPKTPIQSLSWQVSRSSRTVTPPSRPTSVVPHVPDVSTEYIYQLLICFVLRTTGSDPVWPVW